MKTIYTIDNGNGHPHVGIFKTETPERIVPLKDFKVEDGPFSAIISNVGPKVTFPREFEDKLLDIKSLRDEKSFLDMPVNYTETLGMDRLCNAYYVFKNELENGESILLIDAGTFNTFDLITRNGFAGGFILPGSKVFLQSYNRGENLPIYLDAELKSEIPLPTSTEMAIKEGHNLYLLSVINTFIEEYYPDRVILTGGNAAKLEPIVNMPVEVIPHLIHQALFDIAGRVH
ncbi:MAG: type III pantothenate kinase [Deltaproteobacteria bacterium]|nr:MAG: type III pantothenate kinase [Deltaproteobacteria bacterium]